jgi:hypothetical protein
MRKRQIAAAAASLVALGALSLAPSAFGARSCPQDGCEKVGARPGGDARASGKTQRVRLAPRATFDGRGQQIWRAGNHLMQ